MPTAAAASQNDPVAAIRLHGKETSALHMK